MFLVEANLSMPCILVSCELPLSGGRGVLDFSEWTQLRVLLIFRGLTLGVIRKYKCFFFYNLATLLLLIKYNSLKKRFSYEAKRRIY
jgi:hypothetical protein